ncbi:MAG: hypothetical protein ACTHW1_06680 [Ancrocorticia sp.]|uniref:hypothetical protein n=1 Tax=Ancrocorticia sp. TaxID=2593684 RepID=UPI003F92ED67
MKILLIILVTLVVLACLVLYAFFSGRAVFRSGKRAMTIVTDAGTHLAEPFSRYEPLPADDPIASPFLPERRAQAIADLRRVAAVRAVNRRARLERSTARWAVGINPDRFDLPRARARWEERK